jgi:ABC-type sugar transport system ATPase subunit
LDPNQIVRDLPLALQQKVEIMRAFARQARIIIMDEPTSSLTGHETELLHSIMHTVVRSGRTMIYITHMLEAVLEHADRVTVLRDGNLIRTADTGRETKMSLVESMLGSPVDIVFPDRKRTAGTGAPPTLELRQVRSGAEVQDVSLHIDRGEVVGLAGLVGSGRTEVVRAIFGARPLDGGVIRLRGNLHRPRGPRHSIGARVALIPEDRRRQGLVLTSSVQRNIGLLIANRTGRLGHVSEARERAVARELIQELAIHPGDETYQVGLLSGGNQQKVLFAKWMTIDADLILLDEPTRGVDVGAKLHIYRLIAQLAASGASILLISSELEEVMNMSHRVYVMSSGRTVAEVDPAAVSMQEVLSLMFGMTSSAAPPR